MSMRSHTKLEPSSLVFTTAYANDLLITRVLKQVEEISHRAGTVQPRSYTTHTSNLLIPGVRNKVIGSHSQLDPSSPAAQLIVPTTCSSPEFSYTSMPSRTELEPSSLTGTTAYVNNLLIT